MSWWSDFKDGLSSAWKSLKKGDVFGAAEDLFNASFDAITLGTFSYGKDQIRGLLEFPDIPYQDRKRTVRAPTGPRQVVYGRTRTGGQLAYIESWFDDKRFLTMTLIVAAHPVEEITAVYANGRKVASVRTASGNGRMAVVNDGKFNVAGEETRIFCWSAKGDQTTWVPPTVTPSGNSRNPPGWTSNHKLLGQAYVHIFCWYHEDKFESGLPKFDIELKGKNDIYDPRSGTTGYTDNQALIALDVLRWERMFNLPNSRIDLPSFASGANVADELVSAGPGKTEKRYTVNGAFLMQAPPLEVLDSVASAGAAFLLYTQGKWKFVPGAYANPVMDLNESDLVGGLSFQPGPGKRARHNMARGSYVDANQNFETVEFRELRVSGYVSDDLQELERSFDFPWTTSGTMARRLAKVEIERGRHGLSVNLVAKFKALRLTPGDRIRLSVERLGWVSRVFRVEETNLDMNAGVKLQLREDAPGIYAWEEGDALALDPPPPLNLPDGLEISPPKNIMVGEELYQTLTRAAVKVRMLLSWDADDVAKAYNIQYKLATASKWEPAATFWQDNDIEINDVKDALYDVRLQAINTIGARSAWVQLQYLVEGKSAPPPDVETLFIENGILKWTYADAPLDLAGFEVRFQNGNRQIWTDATPVTGNLITETQFDVSKFAGTKTFMVRAIDTTGNLSANIVYLVQNLGDPLVENVVQAISEAPAWSGSVTGGQINAEGELEAVPLGVFWGDPQSIFWPTDPTALFWEEDYGRVEYEFTVAVAAQDAGASLTVEVLISGNFNESLSYKPPGFSGDWIGFPGAVTARQGVYRFRLVIPQQKFGAPPTVSDIISRLDVPDIEESFNDVVIAAGGTRLPITRTYRAIQNVSLTRQSDGGNATDVVYIDKNPELGPLIETRNSAGTSVAGTIDARIQGY